MRHFPHELGIVGLQIAPPPTAESILPVIDHLHQFHPGDSPQNLSRRLVDAALPPQVAGIVVGDPHGNLPQRQATLIHQGLQQLHGVQDLHPDFLPHHLGIQLLPSIVAGRARHHHPGSAPAPHRIQVVPDELPRLIGHPAQEKGIGAAPFLPAHQAVRDPRCLQDLNQRLRDTIARREQGTQTAHEVENFQRGARLGHRQSPLQVLRPDQPSGVVLPRNVVLDGNRFPESLQRLRQEPSPRQPLPRRQDKVVGAHPAPAGRRAPSALQAAEYLESGLLQGLVRRLIRFRTTGHPGQEGRARIFLQPLDQDGTAGVANQALDALPQSLIGDQPGSQKEGDSIHSPEVDQGVRQASLVALPVHDQILHHRIVRQRFDQNLIRPPVYRLATAEHRLPVEPDRAGAALSDAARPAKR